MTLPLEAKLWINKWMVPILIACFVALTPIHSILLVVMILIFGDMLLGIWAAIKQKEPVTSSRLRDTVSKLFIYFMVLILGFIVQKYLMWGEVVPIVKLAASAIGIVEFKSILENSSIILGNNHFKFLITKLGSSNRDK